MLGDFLTYFLIFTLLMCFLVPRIGVSLYLLYYLVVPVVVLNVGSLRLEQNFVNSIIIIAVLLKYANRLRDFDFSMFKPFLFLFICQLVLIPFHLDKMGFSDQINYFRIDFMGSLLFPLAIVNVGKFDPTANMLYRRALTLSIVIIVVYGIMLIETPGLNPWVIANFTVSGREFDENYALAQDDGRLFGRISSVFIHPMTYGLFLSFALVYIFAIHSSSKYPLFLSVVFILILIAIATCGVRTVIVTVILGVLIYLFLSRSIKSWLVVLGLTFLGSVILGQFEEFNLFFNSIFNSNSNDVRGSSAALRLEQFYGCLKIVKDNNFAGLGYGWTTYYLSKFGVHSEVLAFESLIYVVICNNGFCGVIIWVIFAYMVINYLSQNFVGVEKRMLIILFMSYFFYSSITGEYGYMKYFLIFYALLIINFKKDKNQLTAIK